MKKYILKRLLLVIPVLLGVSLIIFGIMAIKPGDPARLLLGATASQEAVDQLNESFGLNLPFYKRYLNYIYNAFLHFDLGDSWRTGLPVLDEILVRLPVSLKIASLGIIGASLIGIPLGVLSAVKQYSILDNTTRIFAIFFSTVPSFWLAMMMVYVFAVKLHLLPSSGMDNWTCYILPMVAISLPYASGFLRMTRSTVLETIRADYVCTARAKGVPERRVIFQHALRNAWLPIISTMTGSFGGILGSAIITETVFNMPGLGTMIVSGIRQFDTPIVMGGTIVLAFSFALIMLLADLLYAFVDPRIRAKYSK